MRNFCLAVAALFVLAACTVNNELLNDAGLSISSEQIILTEEKYAEEAITIFWDDFAPGKEYTVMIANLYSVGWDNVWSLTTKETAVNLTVGELEEALLGIGREAGSDAYIKIMVKASYDGQESTTIIKSAVVRLYIPMIQLKVPEVTATATSVMLTEATKMDKALELKWTDSSVENEKCYYEIEFAYVSDENFSNPIFSDVIQGQSVFFYQLDFNVMLLKAGFNLGDQTELIYRIKAIPENDKVKGSVSEVCNIMVTSYKRPVPENVESIYIAGSGVESGWNIPSEVGKFRNMGNGIFEWQGSINDNGGTFKVLFNGGWSCGFRHGSNDYYWEDAQYVTNIGDDDYGVVLAKGIYKLTVDVNKGTLSREIIKGERNVIEIVDCKTFTPVEIPSINENNTIFQGNVSLDSESGFIVVHGDGNRNYVRNTKDPEFGIRWHMSERRSKDDDNESLWFFPLETKSYKVTVDIQKNMLILE